MKKFIITINSFMFFVFCFAINTFGSGVQSMKLYTGTVALLRDATTALMVIISIVCGLAILFFQIMKGLADQQEQQIWGKRTKNAIISGIIGMSASGIVALITSYYS